MAIYAATRTTIASRTARAKPIGEGTSESIREPSGHEA